MSRSASASPPPSNIHMHGKQGFSVLKKLKRKLSPKKHDDQSNMEDGVSSSKELFIELPTEAVESVRRSSSAAGGVEQVFKYFDENGDGKLSPTELQKALGDNRLSLDAAEAVVSSTDSDGDGLLCLKDFTKLVEAEKEEDKGQDLQEAFRAYTDPEAVVDTTKNCITPTSLRNALQILLGETKSLGDCKAIIRCFDLNGDGVLCFEEFRTMMTMA